VTSTLAGEDIRKEGSNKCEWKKKNNNRVITRRGQRFNGLLKNESKKPIIEGESGRDRGFCEDSRVTKEEKGCVQVNRQCLLNPAGRGILTGRTSSGLELECERKDRSITG